MMVVLCVIDPLLSLKERPEAVKRNISFLTSNYCSFVSLS